jgi:hypothetical protein
VEARLEPPAAALFGRQIESTEYVQRLGDDGEVDLYPSRRGAQWRDPAIAFPNLTTEVRLASVALAGPGGTTRADVHLVQGHLFQIAFKPSPRALGPPSELRVTGMTIHLDPMIATADPGIDSRLGELDPGLRLELEAMWADGSAGRAGLAAPGETYRIDLDDGEHLVLAQFDDTSFLVAPIDPARPGVRRFWPDGGLASEYPDVHSALVKR